jgi:hypothetical protein
MIRDGLLRDPERHRGGHIPKLNREQAIAIFTSAEPQHVRGILGFSRITPEQIKLIRTIPD